MTCKKYAAPTLQKVALTVRPYPGEAEPSLDSLTRGLPFVVTIEAGTPVERPVPWHHPLWSRVSAVPHPARAHDSLAQRRARTLRLAVLAVLTALISWWLSHQ